MDEHLLHGARRGTQRDTDSNLASIAEPELIEPLRAHRREREGETPFIDADGNIVALA